MNEIVSIRMARRWVIYDPDVPIPAEVRPTFRDSVIHIVRDGRDIALP